MFKYMWFLKEIAITVMLLYVCILMKDSQCELCFSIFSGPEGGATEREG